MKQTIIAIILLIITAQPIQTLQTDSNSTKATLVLKIKIIPEVITDLRSLVVFPNPVKKQDKLFFKNVPNKNKCHLKIFNLAGELVVSQEMDSPVHSFDPHNLARGIYFYLVQDGKGNRKSGRVAILK